MDLNVTYGYNVPKWARFMASCILFILLLSLLVACLAGFAIGIFYLFRSLPLLFS